MGVTDVPQWLPAAFVRSALAVGATASRDEIEGTCHRLLERWQEPDRHFHNCKHLIDMLARVDELAEETHNPDMVRLAAWYHGAVFSSVATKTYARSGGEDEVASAALAREELGALGVPEPALDRIAELILGLKRHEIKSKDIDCLALSDADLGILAADPQKYQAYRKAVRAEYTHIPLRHYVEARSAIVSKLLARRNIFVSPMGQQWEDAARENLTAELGRLRKELESLGEAGPEGTVAAAEAAHDVVADAPAPDDPSPHVFEAAVGRPAVPAGAPWPGPEDPRTRTAPAEPRPTGAGTDAEADGTAFAGPPADEDRVLQSSLESLPADLSPRGRGESHEEDRAAVARTSRDLVEQAVRRAGRDRAERPRRRDVTRALHEHEPRAVSRASTLTPPSPASAPTPDSVTRPDGPRGPERSDLDEPPTGEQPAAPQHGIEREPDLLDRPRKKKRKDGRRDR
ncbi:hypothetical protein [Georgenia alba]|uniref:Metal-dependent HD superfamily phosphohydrolase n=1 Tax=Georgenia alba TaxID=2233858 RepID=A0ABW2Q6E6_9MICO